MTNAQCLNIRVNFSFAKKENPEELFKIGSKIMGIFKFSHDSKNSNNAATESSVNIPILHAAG